MIFNIGQEIPNTPLSKNKINMTVILNNLNNALVETQENIIGIVIRNGKDVTLLIEEDEHTAKTISIGLLGGLCTDYVPKAHDQFKVIRFPDGKSLAQMLKEPLDFHSWYEENATPFIH